MKKTDNRKRPFVKKVTSQPNSDKPERQKLPFENYLDFRTLTMIPISDQGLDILGSKLIHWATTCEDALKLSQFWIQEGICPKDARRWMERHHGFHRAVNIAKEAIGNRREVGGLRKIYDSSMVRLSMPVYDAEWLSLEEWRSKMQGPENGGGTQIVIMEKTPDSELVPRKTPEEVAAGVGLFKKVNKTSHLNDY